jgi:hypothetical protein
MLLMAGHINVKAVTNENDKIYLGIQLAPVIGNGDRLGFGVFSGLYRNDWRYNFESTFYLWPNWEVNDVNDEWVEQHRRWWSAQIAMIAMYRLWSSSDNAFEAGPEFGMQLHLDDPYWYNSSTGVTIPFGVAAHYRPDPWLFSMSARMLFVPVLEGVNDDLYLFIKIGYSL